MVLAVIGETAAPARIVKLQHMSPGERDETIRAFIEQLRQAPEPVRAEKRQWLKQQWSALSPDERDQLRNQVREHWRRMPPEQRQRLREERRLDPQRPEPAFDYPGRQEYRPQRLSPDERQEFRQWMRERGGGRQAPP